MHAAPPQPTAEAQTDTVFQRLLAILTASGLPHALHAHQATRTMADAERHLSFDPARIVKTVAFRTRAGTLALAALRGLRRVDYARLAALLGVNRRDLAALSPPEVLTQLGVEPGSVSPLCICLLDRVAGSWETQPVLGGGTMPTSGAEAVPVPGPGAQPGVAGEANPVACGGPALPGRAGRARLLVDEDVLEIRPSLYCGIGRPDRTLEVAAQNLLRLVAHSLGSFSR